MAQKAPPGPPNATGVAVAWKTTTGSASMAAANDSSVSTRSKQYAGQGFPGEPGALGWRSPQNVQKASVPAACGVNSAANWAGVQPSISSAVRSPQGLGSWAAEMPGTNRAAPKTSPGRKAREGEEWSDHMASTFGEG